MHSTMKLAFPMPLSMLCFMPESAETRTDRLILYHQSCTMPEQELLPPKQLDVSIFCDPWLSG
jgi:hypothetical protein